MNAKNNRQNHDFQLAYFIAGSCHTADGAWSILSDQLENRSDALAMSSAEDKRTEAKMLRAKMVLEASTSEPDILEAEADLMEIEATSATHKRCVEACRKEIAFIELLMRRIEPFRKFSHLPDDEAHEACQALEWELELLHRAETEIATLGRVETSTFNTMRQHPSFKSTMLPMIANWSRQLEDPIGREQFLESITDRSGVLRSMLLEDSSKCTQPI